MTYSYRFLMPNHTQYFSNLSGDFRNPEPAACLRSMHGRPDALDTRILELFRKLRAVLPVEEREY